MQFRSTNIACYPAKGFSQRVVLPAEIPVFASARARWPSVTAVSCVNLLCQQHWFLSRVSGTVSLAFMQSPKVIKQHININIVYYLLCTLCVNFMGIQKHVGRKKMASCFFVLCEIIPQILRFLSIPLGFRLIQYSIIIFCISVEILNLWKFIKRLE